ncbi:Membrane attack complex component/perforin/complement C9 [Macleaya cordata]|uniref:Membrane attack complex component/perforin/complement C9 n=1 Tax=Macleaya cordata TaxID=56857 RepID=A0A200QM60_MACCD|nr:Membrane attack complex component/perforin/complement C9 [Macleaya cordata]
MNSNHLMNPQSTAEKAVSVIGFGYDLSNDIRLSYCKSGPSGSSLIEFDRTLARELVFPGGIVVPNVPNSIKCDKGERTRFRSEVVSFPQMSEKFNQELSLSGKIPPGSFNAMFGFQGCWQKDATSTKCLAFDGWFITLYNVELERSQIVLSEHVIQELPSSWDPGSIARFIEKYGTHIVVGVKMGGKDVVHIKQLANSNLQSAEVQKMLKNLADKRFSEEVNGSFMLNPQELQRKLKDEQIMAWQHGAPFAKSIRPIVFHTKEDIVSIHVRKGGVDKGQSHDQWLPTISQSPDVISMSLVPITSLLNGVRGGGFLSHAINLYLRYRPPLEDLHQFLEFQLSRQWAPVYADLPLRRLHKKHGSPSLQFTFMGPRLYVNTDQVDSGNRPVTGIRLYLEGKKSDHIAIHLQHLSTLPKILQLSHDCSYAPNKDILSERDYYEPVKWSLLSHVCTAPVEYNAAQIDESASIVTKAWFEVRDVGMRKVLFLRLGFSMVASARLRRSEWDGPTHLSRKSGSIAMFISTRFSTNQILVEKPSKVELNSAVYPSGPPTPTKAPKITRFVDVKEMVRGPEDSPGYWVVTGAKLCVVDGKISLKVKYSLLTMMLEADCC